MLAQEMQSITACLNYLRSYFLEDKEAKKVLYLEKLETTLNLANKFFQKYGKEKRHEYSCYNIIVVIYTGIGEDDCKWQIKYKNQTQNTNEYMNTKELALYCWDNQMNIKNFIEYLFNYINDFISKKQQVVKVEKDKYNAEINAMDEAIGSLQELIDMDISEDIKNK